MGEHNLPLEKALAGLFQLGVRSAAGLARLRLTEMRN